MEGMACDANSTTEWDRLWAEEGRGSWRGKILAPVYERIAELIPRNSRVLDIGGGVGLLADVLRDKAGCTVCVVDQSYVAVQEAGRAGHSVVCIPISDAAQLIGELDVVVGTEVIEHLDDNTLHLVLEKAQMAFFSVPNDRLGPEEEPQHVRKFTALGFKQMLEQHFTTVRVECLGPIQADTHAPAFLLGVCGLPKQNSRLAVTMPVRDEVADIARTLASFRGVADDLVVGIDPRTKDATREIAWKYADLVFELEDPEGRTQPDPPPIKDDGSDAVHFAWLRNQCLQMCRDRCADWIFMTEGHESLDSGIDTLLALDRIMPSGAKIGWVTRRANGQRWCFPWLIRADDTRLRYERNTHNCLTQPDGVLSVRLSKVQTLHLRDHRREKERAVQRKAQNRKSLMDDWLQHGSVNSLFYLANEWRAFDRKRSVERLREYIQISKNGAGRYQAGLTLAKELALRGDTKEAREVLLACTGYDWSRTEHWIFLGDLAYESGQYEEALQFWRYGATLVGHDMPFSAWWIEESLYGYIAAQRMAMGLAAVQQFAEALEWAEKVPALLPEGTPEEVRLEVDSNIAILQEAKRGNGHEPHEPYEPHE
jgi:tetratricopeptide (TPR) repeat protein